MSAFGWAGKALRQESFLLALELPSFVSPSFLPCPSLLVLLEQLSFPL